MNWIKSAAVNLLLFGVTLTICLGLVEIALNFVSVKGGVMEESGESRSLRLKLFPANYQGSRKPDDYYLAETNGSIEQKDYLITTDRYQSLTIRGTADRSDLTATRNVMFLGGSTTETLFVDEEMRWPELAVTMANRDADGGRYAAFNYGVSGNSLIHSTLNLFAYGRIVQPKVVIVHHLINDLRILSEAGTYVTARGNARDYFVTSSAEGLVLGIARIVRRYLLPNIGDLIARLRAGFGGSNERRWALDLATENGLQGIAESYFAQIHEILVLTELLGAKPIIVIQAIVADHSAPHFAEIRERNLARGVNIDHVVAAHQALAVQLAAFAEARGISVVDLRDLGNDTMMYDLMHYNEAGSAAVAERIAAALRSQ